MEEGRHINDFVNLYMKELGLRIVAESGRPKDCYHIGKLLLQSMRDAPDFLAQIDGGTGESETNGSVLDRSIRCAISFKKMGLDVGDVIVLLAPNHIDLAIPIYAALFLGISIAAADRTSAPHELNDIFDVNKPKIVFCQSEKYSDVKAVLDDLKMPATIITFDNCSGCLNFKHLCESATDCSDIQNFKATDFDPEETYSFLVATSGSTGKPKTAAVTHKNVISYLPYWMSLFDEFPTPTKMCLVVSPIQWISAIGMCLCSAILRFSRLQTSSAITVDHAYFLINKYKPTFAIFSPPFITSLIKSENSDECDFTCFESIIIGGSAVSSELIRAAQGVSPKTHFVVAYGLSEVGVSHLNDHPHKTSEMRPVGTIKCHLADSDGNIIRKPNVPGELWVEGPSIFKGYYNNPEATNESFSVDGCFKTGDMMYRDECHNYYFVDRIKMLLKYKNLQISPVEIEEVISQHPEVSSVIVTGIPDKDCGELPVACVVRRSGAVVTAKQIKDLVKDKLSDAKRLRGGVIFMDALPLTPTSKINRKKVKELAINSIRE